MSPIIKLQPVFIIFSAFLGLVLGYTTTCKDFYVQLIEPFLMVLLFFIFLSADGEKLTQSFKNIKFALTALSINFIWTPFFAFALGVLCFPDSLELQIGLLMLLVTPCTDWYLVFTSIAAGNVELGASILPLNLLLQILLLPAYLFLFFGDSVALDKQTAISSILIVLIIPLLLSFLAKAATHTKTFLRQKVAMLQAHGDAIQLLFLCLAVAAMFASESKNVLDNPMLLLRMLIPLAAFFAVNLFMSRLIGQKVRLPRADVTALCFTTLARNSPLSLAIAVAAFPQLPLISLALVIGPLIELPALSLIATAIQHMEKRES